MIMSTRSEPTGGWRMSAPGMSPMDGVPDGHHAGDLRALTRRIVRAALRADRRRPGPEPDAQMLQLLRVTCNLARANHTLVEQLLILLKEAWREQPDARPLRHSDAVDTLARVITLCIAEYYAPTQR